MERDEDADAQIVKSGMAIVIGDNVHERLVEGASVQLNLLPVLLEGEDGEARLSGVRVKADGLADVWEEIDFERLNRFEMIVADEPVARRIRTHLMAREEKGEGVPPAVIAAVERSRTANAARSDEDDQIFDGVLQLPQAPAAIAAQLSLILYAHRAFARRYQSAIEELNLNRRIFRSVTSGICVTDATRQDLPITYVNPAFEVMTGYSLEEVLGKNCRFLQGAERDQPALELVREAVRDQREVVAVLRNFRKDGTPFWNELSLSPIRNREGELTHFVGIQTDVTARVEFEAALRESEKLAAVGRLASSIAHEINNPLESVMNLLYLAERTEELHEARVYLAAADKELRRVKLITSQSLRFYKQSTRPQAIGCAELVDSVLDLYQAKLLNSDVRVERRERSTQSIVCMESEIRQVLNNLVSNAIDAMHGKGGRLLVRSREATDWRSGGRGVLMTIADTGSGISRESLRHIYEAFYTTKGIGGTGLGLWISSEIVVRHHGRLRVRSAAGGADGSNGTVFALFLPYQGLVPESK